MINMLTTNIVNRMMHIKSMEHILLPLHLMLHIVLWRQ